MQTDVFVNTVGEREAVFVCHKAKIDRRVQHSEVIVLIYSQTRL
jgi:hypothetical protein